MKEADLATILQRVASHAAKLAEMVQGAEHAIGNELGQSRDCTDMIRPLQNLDYLRQSLEDLTILMAELGRQPGLDGIKSTGLDHACAALRLADTRALFHNPAHPSAGTIPSLASGELDLF